MAVIHGHFMSCWTWYQNHVWSIASTCTHGMWLIVQLICLFKKSEYKGPYSSGSQNFFGGSGISSSKVALECDNLG